MLQEFKRDDYFDYEPEPPLIHNEDVWVKSSAYVNLGPKKIRELMESDDPSVDQEAVRVALDYWGKNNGFESGFEVGEPYRGEAPEFTVADTMRDILSDERVESVIPGDLTVKRPSQKSDMPIIRDDDF
jgi:hypothetical protein